jgi:hypothetical protein
MTSKTVRALNEISELLSRPQRIIPLLAKMASDEARRTFASHHLYSYTTTSVPTALAVQSVVDWILHAQCSDGGIPAYYSFLTGYSAPYPEVTGYIIPTLYDFAEATANASAARAAERATDWLLELQMPSGAFPGGLHNGGQAEPSIFNTGQILQGLVRASMERKNAAILERAAVAGDWLTKAQSVDGAWSGAGAYQGSAHTYYSMVSWALAQLAGETGEARYLKTASKNIEWVLKHARAGGWIDGINLHGHAIYLHFIAYVIQGILECGILLQRDDAIAAAAKAAWVLLRKFETHKRLLGTYEPDFRPGLRFACLTGNAQMCGVWLRLFQVSGDLRYLNAALKMNEMLKQSLRLKGVREIAGGVAGSQPIWGAYQPMRLISWGGKFLADSLLLEQRLLQQLDREWQAKYEATKYEAPQCAS